MADVKNEHGLLDHGTLKSAVSQEGELIKWADFCGCWYKLRKASVNLIISGCAWSKMSNTILERIWEMTKKLYAHSA